MRIGREGSTWQFGVSSVFSYICKTGWTRPGFAVLQNPECSRCLERSGQRDFGTNFSKILCEDTLDFCKSRYMISESLRVEPRAHLGASQCVCRHSRNPAHQATRCTATTQPQAAAHPGGQSAALSGGCAVVLHDGGLTVQISAWSAPTVAHTTVRAGMRTAGCGTAARAGRGALPSRCAGGAQCERRAQSPLNLKRRKMGEITHTKRGSSPQPFFSARFLSKDCCCCGSSDERLVTLAFLFLQQWFFFGHSELVCVEELSPDRSFSVTTTAPTPPQVKITGAARVEELPGPQISW